MNFKILGFYLILTLSYLPSTIYSTKELQHKENSNASVTKSKGDSTRNNSAHGYTHQSLNAHTLEAIGNHQGIQNQGLQQYSSQTSREVSDDRDVGPNQGPINGDTPQHSIQYSSHGISRHVSASRQYITEGATRDNSMILDQRVRQVNTEPNKTTESTRTNTVPRNTTNTSSNERLGTQEETQIASICLERELARMTMEAIDTAESRCPSSVRRNTTNTCSNQCIGSQTSARNDSKSRGQGIARGHTELDETAQLVTPYTVHRGLNNSCSEQESEGNQVTSLQGTSSNDPLSRARSTNNGQHFMRVVSEANPTQVEGGTSRINVDLTAAIDPTDLSSQLLSTYNAQVQLVYGEASRYSRMRVPDVNQTANEINVRPGPTFGQASYQVFGEYSGGATQNPVSRGQGREARLTSPVIRQNQRSGSTPFLLEMLGSVQNEVIRSWRGRRTTCSMYDTTNTAPSIRYRHAPAQYWSSCGFCGAIAPVYVYCIDGRWHTMCLSCEAIIRASRATS